MIMNRGNAKHSKHTGLCGLVDRVRPGQTRRDQVLSPRPRTRTRQRPHGAIRHKRGHDTYKMTIKVYFNDTLSET